ncbi:MAG: hypothetical protein LBV40_04920 [Methanomicrobiales archaeon]|jgi:hypothetical protein|nr:hypothetical protein [Methanomicrobiales archaeon]
MSEGEFLYFCVVYEVVCLECVLGSFGGMMSGGMMSYATGATTLSYYIVV